MSTVKTVVIAWAFVFTWYALNTLKDRDMVVCQLTHSHDTCFNALNR